jgi:hypothetical protein
VFPDSAASASLHLPFGRAPRLRLQRLVNRHQRDACESVARHLECDDDKERFEKRLGKLAKPKARQS